MPNLDANPDPRTLSASSGGGVDVPRRNDVSPGSPPSVSVNGDESSAMKAHPEAEERQDIDFSHSRVLAMADMAAIVVSMLLVVAILSLMGRTLHSHQLGTTVVVMLPVWLLIAYIAGLYSEADLRIDRSLVDEIGTVTIAVTAWSWLLLVARTALSGGPTAMLGPVLLWGLVIVMMLMFRATARAVVSRRVERGQEIALIGEESGMRALRERIDRHPEWGLTIKTEIESGSHLLMADLLGVVRTSGADRVMLVGGDEGLSDRTLLVQQLIEQGLKVDIVSGGPETLYSNAALQDLEGLPVLSVRPTEMRALDLRMKRALDVVISGIGLIFVAPILAWAAIRIKLDSPGPVFFRQVRCGQHGEEFEVLKLRTMIDGADEMRSALRKESAAQRNGDILFKLEDDPRITKCGRSLRKWSIDELPQLWNVFIGEMSMVGPRPLPFDEAIQATGLFLARTRVKPGIAGPWQAYGRSSIPFDDMMKLDYSYVAAWSMAEDIRLLLRTAVAVVRRRGAH